MSENYASVAGLIEVEALAKRFSHWVRVHVGDPEKVAEINRRNAAYAARSDVAVCASHEFIDANESMICAVEEFGIEEWDPNDQALVCKVNDAWTLAKMGGFAL